MYEKVNVNSDSIAREKEVLKFWKENDVFRKSLALRADAPVFTFYDGPPTANGKPHIGHVITRVIKDLIPRYRTMKGYYVPRKAGWDTHGLPVEIEVEKQLGISGKEQIEQYGIEPFLEKCKQSVWKYKQMWEDFSDTVGFWADMDDPYVTYHNSYIESEWWAFKQIFERGLLYKGFKVVPYCPRCGTPLSSHEVAQGYKDVKERSAFVKFRMKGEDAWILAWTTTPWTLPSNVALCVNPDAAYARVQYRGEIYYMAEQLVPAVLGEEAQVLETFPGRSLEYREYEPLFDLVHPAKKGWYVTCNDYVTLGDGTGVVHIAPAFGEDDAKVGRAYDLPFVQLVNNRGEMTEQTPWAGAFCKDADPLILDALEKRGQLFSAPVFEHSYPHCWRCDMPLIYYARESWFVDMSAVKDQLVANNNTVNWMPESIGKGRFGDWLENIQDWAISRNRYWGCPLPIWECACGHQHAVGSVAELRELAGGACPDELDLHRPYVDRVTFPCPKCGGEMRRVPEVVDCWFDSGSMPFAQHHYPFENQDLFKQQFPAAFISEAVDQTRGWFYSLIAISTLLFGKAPYENVLVLGHVLDEDGQKMSKSKGNAVDPAEALATYGADAIRWYFCNNSAPWLPNRFSPRAVTEGQRKFLATLYNTYAFYVLYAEIDQFDPTQHTLDAAHLTVMDRWLLSRLHTLIREVDGHLEHYRITETTRALDSFVDELSNWYVRRSRERFWGTEMTEDKAAAYMTLYTALVTLAKLAAPVVPFISEQIYRNLVCSVDAAAPISVHLCDYPQADARWIDPELEQGMAGVLQVATLGRAARNAASVKNRQPLRAVYVKSDTPLGELFQKIVLDELNIKAYTQVTDTSRFTAYTFKPQLKIVGQKYGKQVGAIRQALAELDGGAAYAELQQTGGVTLQLPDGPVTLSEEELLIDASSAAGYAVQEDRGVTVALDITLDDALIEEGFVRELVSKLQTMRKDAGFEVTDHIAVTQAGNSRIEAILRANRAAVMGDVLADSMEFGTVDGYTAEWDVNGEKTQLGVKKL